MVFHMRTSTRAQDDDEEATPETERGGIQSLSEGDSSDIVKSGPRAEEALGSRHRKRCDPEG
jgi:hypothetical protein